jgi:cytoskeletal protein CcmA (bactofilin family)
MRFPWSSEPDRQETVIAEGASIAGGLVARGPVHVQGRVEGPVRCEDHLFVGRQGEVLGNVWGRVVTIGGRVVGRVEATERAEVLSTGRLTGDIHAPAVSIEVGAVFEGATHMGTVASPVRPSPVRRADRPGPPPGPPETAV